MVIIYAQVGDGTTTIVMQERLCLAKSERLTEDSVLAGLILTQDMVILFSIGWLKHVLPRQAR